MSASAPGPVVSADLAVERWRKPPRGSEVLVGEGDRVVSADPVARVEVRGPVHTLFAAAALGISRAELPSAVLVAEGERVIAGQPLARSGWLFGLLKSVVSSPVDGVVESISKVSGQIVLREGAGVADLPAYVAGQVASVSPDMGVRIDARMSIVQGIFGVGGEIIAELTASGRGPGERLTEEHVLDSHRGKILLGGGRVTLAGMRAMVDRGVAGLVTGSVGGLDLVTLLGREINLAATGDEDVGFTLVITEGFGDLAMSRRAHRLLEALEGETVSMCGATQVRAGVVRPEVLGPPRAELSDESGMGSGGDVQVGSPVRITRGEHFGARGRILEIPIEQRVLATGAEGYVYVVELEEGEAVIVPRPNVEL